MRSRIVMAGSLAACLLAAVTAHGQSSRLTPAPRSFIPNEDDAKPNVPPPISTLAPARGISGPRLEPGAVLCRSEADLEHRAEVTRRISDGQDDPGQALAGCRLIAVARGVDILSRVGMGRSQVRLQSSGEIGWTDAYFR